MAFRLFGGIGVMGKAIEVANAQPHPAAADKYYALKVEGEDGKGEKWLLFTFKELDGRPTLEMGAAVAAAMKRGRLYPHRVNGKGGQAVKIAYKGAESVVLLGAAAIAAAERRAARNPEDIPAQSALGNLLD